MKIQKSNRIGNRHRPYGMIKTAFNVGRMAYKGYNMFKGSFKKSGRQDTGVTVQRDVTTQYTKKRMPRGKKRKWVKFVRKVNAVKNSEKNVRSIVINSGIDIQVDTNQSWGIVHLYGGSGIDDTFANETGCRDLLRIAGQDAEIYSNGKAAKLRFASACLDLTFTNSGANTMEVDVYKIYYGYNERDMPSFNHVVTTGQSYTNALNSSEVTINSRGATPFSLGGMISAGKVKIAWKKKYLMGGGQSATLQHRDPRNRFVNMSDITVPPVEFLDPVPPPVIDFTFKRFTTSYLFIVKYTNPDIEPATADFFVRASRSYNYYIEPRLQNLSFNEFIGY